MGKYTTIRLSDRDRELIESIARKYDLSISDVIRIAIKEFLKKNEINLKEATS